MRSISIIHPSRGRPEMAYATASEWLRKASSFDIEYILSLDRDNAETYYTAVKGLVAITQITTIENKNKSAVEAINEAAKIAIGDILIVISDDFSCPEHWDTLLLDAIGNQTDFCAKTIDGQQDWLITLPIMDRKYYERLGYIYHPSYAHMYADLDMTCTAHLLGKYISLPIEFHHNHPRYTDQVYDATYQRARATWGQGQKAFRERMQRNFDIVSDMKLPKDELIKQGIR